MPQALTLCPVIRNYGIKLGAPYRASTSLHQNQALAVQACGASPVSGTCIVCVCVCVGGGGD